MTRLSYVGPSPQLDPDVGNRLQATTILDNAPINRTTAASQVHDEAVNNRASKTYVDNQDNTFALISYYQTRDALNLPNSAKGAANGVATLTASSKVPTTQMPGLGAGYLRGPFGPTTLFTASTGTTPAKIADFNIGVQSLPFRPLIYASVFVTVTNNTCPIVEAKISDGSQSYANQTLYASGSGRTFFNDVQAVAVVPGNTTLGQVGGGNHPSTWNIWVTLWLYAADASGTVSVDSSGVVSGVTYLMRTQQ